MKKILFFSLILMWTGMSLQAQEVPQFSQYHQHLFLQNPAATGIEDYWNISLGYRQQWVSMDGAPKTFFAAVHGNTKALPNTGNYSLLSGRNHGRRGRGSMIQSHGIGLYAMADQMGPVSQMSYGISYSQHYRINRDWFFSLGVHAGIFNLEYDMNELWVKNPNDITYQNYLNSNANTHFLDVNAGAMIFHEHFYAGYSINHLLNGVALSSENPFGDYLKMHHFLTAAGRINVDRSYDIIPMIQLKYMNPAPPSVEMNVRIKYDNIMWFGLGYRHKESVIGGIGFTVNDFLYVGYTYDYPISSLTKFSKGSHEIGLGVYLFNDYNEKLNKFLW